MTVVDLLGQAIARKWHRDWWQITLPALVRQQPLPVCPFTRYPTFSTNPVSDVYLDLKRVDLKWVTPTPETHQSSLARWTSSSSKRFPPAPSTATELPSTSSGCPVRR